MRIDMSSRLITARLKRVSELRRLCLALGRSTPVATQEPGMVREPTAESDYKIDQQRGMRRIKDKS